jgi:LCP family protein required for cell wall assembly
MPVNQNLRNGMRAAQVGRKDEAIAAFRAVLGQDPNNETALLWLGYLSDDPQVSLDYITQAMETHLQSPRAYAALQWAWQRAAAAPAPVPVPASMPAAAVSPRAEARPTPALPVRHRPGARWVMARLPAVGVLVLLIAIVGCAIGFPMLAQPPAMPALASAFTSAPQPTATAIVPLATEQRSGAVLASAALAFPSPTATGVPAALQTPLPTAALTVEPLTVATQAPTATPSPTALPTSTPVPVDLVVPEPFPNPGPLGYVPSTTLAIPTPVQPVPVASDAINIAVLGSDKRDDWTEWHTDVVQIVSIQRQSKTVSVISIPRDLYLYIPTLWMSRINFADFYGDAYNYEGGGPALLRDTLLYNLGIRMDYYVRTNFDGLIGIVNTVGGVDIPVHCGLSDHWPYRDESGEYPILTMEPGIRHMDGETALWYARSRLTTSVFSRERRQQQVLQALWHKGREAGVLTQVPALWKQGQEMITTDLTLSEVLDLARIALTLDDNNVRFYNIGRDVVTPWTTPYGGAVFLPRWDDIQPIVAEAMAPPPEARLVRTYMPVEVWNGTPNDGWGWLAVDRLYRTGFPAMVAESDRQDYAQTQLIILSSRTKGTGAGYLQHMFGLSDDQVIHQPDESAEFGFRLILGADYQTCPEVW